jgi:hypothetical protein
MTPPSAEGWRRPPAWRLGAPGGRRITGDRRGRLGSRRAGRPAAVLPVSLISRQDSPYPDIDARQVTSATAGWQNPAASRLGSRKCRNYSHSSSSPKSCKSAYGPWNGGVGRAPGRPGSAWAGHPATDARTSTAGWKRRARNDPKADSRL